MSKKIVAFTGAGISKASGIPTFEEIKGIKERLTLENKTNNPSDYYAAIDMLKKNCNGKKPNDAHKALAEYKIPIITMNVDMLHQKAGSAFVCELHGNIYDNSIVAYGELVHDWDKAADLLNDCKAHDVLLVIGTSMQTVLANEFVLTAISKNMKVIEINKDTEHKVRKVLEEEVI